MRIFSIKIIEIAALIYYRTKNQEAYFFSGRWEVEKSQCFIHSGTFTQSLAVYNVTPQGSVSFVDLWWGRACKIWKCC